MCVDGKRKKLNFYDPKNMKEVIMKFILTKKGKKIKIAFSRGRKY